MKTEILNKLDALFASSPILRATELPSDTEISEAAIQLGIPFPADYREFLLKYGGAMVGAYPIFGLRPVKVMDDDLWSVVCVTRRCRERKVPGTEAWIVFSEDHAGNPIGIDRKGTVWIHDHDFGGIMQLAADFEEYLRRKCLKMGPS